MVGMYRYEPSSSGGMNSLPNPFHVVARSTSTSCADGTGCDFVPRSAAQPAQLVLEPLERQRARQLAIADNDCASYCCGMRPKTNLGPSQTPNPKIRINAGTQRNSSLWFETPPQNGLVEVLLEHLKEGQQAADQDGDKGEVAQKALVPGPAAASRRSAGCPRTARPRARQDRAAVAHPMLSTGPAGPAKTPPPACTRRACRRSHPPTTRTRCRCRRRRRSGRRRESVSASAS